MLTYKTTDSKNDVNFMFDWERKRVQGSGHKNVRRKEDFQTAIVHNVRAS